MTFAEHAQLLTRTSDNDSFRTTREILHESEIDKSAKIQVIHASYQIRIPGRISERKTLISDRKIYNNLGTAR